MFGNCLLFSGLGIFVVGYVGFGTGELDEDCEKQNSKISTQTKEGVCNTPLPRNHPA